MLVIVKRARKRHNQDMSIDPANVAALFDHPDYPGTSVVRLGSGRGFRVHGTYAQLLSTLGAHLTFFRRHANTRGSNVFPNDPPKIGINLRYVEAILDAGETSSFRMRDGRELSVRANIHDIMTDDEVLDMTHLAKVSAPTPRLPSSLTRQLADATRPDFSRRGSIRTYVRDQFDRGASKHDVLRVLGEERREYLNQLWREYVLSLPASARPAR